jgi:hypothetical protein
MSAVAGVTTESERLCGYRARIKDCEKKKVVSQRVRVSPVGWWK